MRLHLGPHQDVRITGRQFDFFVRAEQALPQWQTLPEEVRRELTSLLTRLILDHAGADNPRLLEEGIA
jgi:hypothetical protein